MRKYLVDFFYDDVVFQTHKHLAHLGNNLRKLPNNRDALSVFQNVAHLLETGVEGRAVDVGSFGENSPISKHIAHQVAVQIPIELFAVLPNDGILLPK